MMRGIRPRRAVASQWMSDPGIASAYAYLRPGGTPADRERLAGPIVPGLRLAGEGTSTQYPGTMHGAWFSGEAAAGALIREGRAGASRQTLVVGAGWAGIAAARDLDANGGRAIGLESAGSAGGGGGTDQSLGVAGDVGGA